MVALVEAVSRAYERRELHPDIVATVQGELAAGRSRRAIAISIGVNRTTIDAIAAGKHTSQTNSRFHRCSRGHKTLLPCRTCAALEELEAVARKRKVSDA